MGPECNETLIHILANEEVQAAMTRRASLAVFLVIALLFGFGCSGSDSPDADSPLDPNQPPAIARDGRLNVDVLIPAEAGKALDEAAREMIAAFARITGVETTAEPIRSSLLASGRPAAVLVEVKPDADEALGNEGYLLRRGIMEPGKHVLSITARTEIGAMYGIYHVLGDLGVLYFHPEDSFYPSSSSITLPWNYSGKPQTPRFAIRGFHEHTQHPIEMSDVYLRPGNSEFRQYASNYIRWMARNRQNLLSFQMLKTVDLDEWLPYMTDIIEEAHEYGVMASMVISFVDQQQHMFKLINEDARDPDSGELLSDEAQIREGLNRLLSAGFDALTFQIGSSEFTKPSDEKTLFWMNTVLLHLTAHHPGVRAYAWIHTTCDLEADDGGYYFHLPLKAGADFGAYVHTTMFYDLKNPAPVYGCENFHQQVEFMDKANRKRPMIYFPESAWWLGFDNNCPLVLPVTGYTRSVDIDDVLPAYDVEGHVTFTTGREWTYWQYDHFLTQKTWDGSLTWDRYLSWISPMYGKQGGAIKKALAAWTDLQAKHFLEEDPLIYFYVAGELRQDEVGEMAGVLARRPKIAFNRILNLDEEAFETWANGDLAMLKRMKTAYDEVLAELPERLDSGRDEQKRYYEEMYSGLYVFAKRIEHAILLYEGVAEVRAWTEERKRAESADPPEEPNATTRMTALENANAKLAAAKAISQEMIGIFTRMEDLYRYPVELLARAKPETPTAYPFGYLEQTSSGHFWTRRDRQLEELIGMAFDVLVEAWETRPDALYTANARSTRLIVPDDPLAGSVITSFLPQLLFGMVGLNLENDTMSLVLAQDFNTNLLPDPDTEQTIPGVIENGEFFGETLAYAVVVRDSAGKVMGDLTLFDAELRFTLQVEGDTIRLTEGVLSGEVTSASLIALVQTVGGIDEEGVSNIIKAIYGVAKDDPLPEHLPTAFSFTLTRATMPRR